MVNALTIDVEDYFNVSGFESHIKFEDWDKFEGRVEVNTDKLLTILREVNVKATFFVLGWIAEKYPKLVGRIHGEGHEIASHGYAHRLVYKQTETEFREDLKRSKGFLEDSIGDRVIGYRAPSYSIVKSSLWAHDILMEEGFLYDSSIFPIRRDRYGIPNGNRFPYLIHGKNNRAILEFPLSTVSILNTNIPVAGGGYLRLFPYRFIKWGLKRINEKESQPTVIYLHPWEIDTNQPRLHGSFLSRFRHYVCLNKMEQRLKFLLCDFKFHTLKDLYRQHSALMEGRIAGI
jgi:polysaccharide deacetylase family protein (PEP-CTERM system associated)